MKHDSVDSGFAPIALFVFKRPEHTLQTLNALAANPEFLNSPLYIYCDGPRDSNDSKEVELTRTLVKNWTHPNKKVIENQINHGLAKSVISGVSHLSETFGRVIVVEDDLVVSDNFLHYLNAALNIYENVPEIMQISAYMFPISGFVNRNEALFLPFISSWGWATWRRAWRYFDGEAIGWDSLLKDGVVRDKFNVGGSYDYADMLLRQMSREIDSWAICWNWSVFQHGGLVLYPPTSLVRNIGFDGSGTHCRVDNFHKTFTYSTAIYISFPENINISREDMILVKEILVKMTGSFFIRMLKALRSNIRRVKKLYFSRAVN